MKQRIKNFWIAGAAVAACLAGAGRAGADTPHVFPEGAVPVAFELTPPEGQKVSIARDGDGGQYLETGNVQAKARLGLRDRPAPGKTYHLRCRLKPQSWWGVEVRDGAEFKRLKVGLPAGRRYARKFGWPQEVIAAVDIYNNRPSNTLDDLGETTLSLAFESDSLHVSLAGVFLDHIPVSPEIFERELELAVTRQQVFYAAAVSTGSSLFQPVDISLHLNASGVGNERIAPESAPGERRTIQVGGVPFMMPADPSGTGRDNLDLGESYVFLGRHGDWNDLKARWEAGNVPNPARLRFRVPHRQYDRLHVLAATDGLVSAAIDTFTVQFYRPSEYSGFPKNFKSPPVPLFTARGVEGRSVEVRAANGQPRYLHLVEVPIDFCQTDEFADLSYLDFELTKEVHVSRAYPDPWFGSMNGGGLPSAVKVFAMTLQSVPVTVEFAPVKLGGIFVEGEKIAFRAVFRNATVEAQRFTARMALDSYDKSDHAVIEREVRLAAGESRDVLFGYAPKRYGHYDIALAFDPAGRSYTYARTASFFRPREYALRDFDTRGHMFGFWAWRGGHNTLSPEDEMEVGGRIGLETVALTLDANKFSDRTREIMRKYKMRSFSAGSTGGIPMKKDAGGQYVLDPEKGSEALAKIEKQILEVAKSDVQDPRYFCVFVEPGGIGTHGTTANFYNEEFVMTEREKDRYASVRPQLITLAALAKKLVPDITVLMPWGDPVYPVPFLQDSPEVTADVDGLAYDAPVFGRLPEAQVSQNSVPHRTYMFNQAWKGRKSAKPEMMTIEGPFVSPVSEAFMTEREYAGNLVRTCLILAAHGINRQFSAVSVADCADWWGEEQYGACGLLSRKSSLNPHVACSTFGTLVRHLRHMEYDGADPTGSLSVYSMRFRDVRDGKLLRVLWTLRGTRPVTIGATGAVPVLYDGMDNLVALQTENGRATLRLDDIPIYLYGLPEEIEIGLGEPDHSDSALGAHHVKIGNAADLLVQEDTGPAMEKEHRDYTEAFTAVVRRFPAAMTATLKTEDVPAAVGGKALAVDFDGQPAVDRLLMPYYSAYRANTALPGVPEHISAYVKGSSDWGRLAFVLRDAKGEVWTSVGERDAYNCDDQKGDSFFVFDSWRLLRLPLPGSLPYDNFRTAGTSWWGSTGGDGVVDYPLMLERVFVERRLKALYADELVAVPNNTPVEIGDIFVEYAAAGAMGAEAVEQSRIRMALPEVAMSDVYGEMREKGKLPPVMILKVEHPDIQDIDGTKGLFFFEENPEAVNYDFYFSFYPDGKGAVRLGSAKKSGDRINGFKANTDMYVFVVYQPRDKQQSLPSPVFKFLLQDLFSQK